MKKEGKKYNQHARCSMHLEKQNTYIYIYIISRGNVHSILTILGKNVLAVRNAVVKFRHPDFLMEFVTLLGVVMNSYLGALHACFSF